MTGICDAVIEEEEEEYPLIDAEDNEGDGEKVKEYDDEVNDPLTPDPRTPSPMRSIVANGSSKYMMRKIMPRNVCFPYTLISN